MHLDLKSSLMLRLVAGALACFFIAAVLALFVLFLIVISPTVVLSSRQSVPPFSLLSGRKFRGCSALPRWSSERFAFYNTEQSAGSSVPQKTSWPASIAWRAATYPVACRTFD